MALRKKLTTGILAHVDAGKTTLSEGLLYEMGVIKQPGRVDKGDAFMDRAEQEIKRGITIFSGQAEMALKDTDVVIMDTPGHVDFSSETERVLEILDCAVLVVSGREGVQGHTLTLWKLLRRLEIPTAIFINKMDIAVMKKEEIMKNLRDNLGEGCFAPEEDGSVQSCESENVAASDEILLEEYFGKGAFSLESVKGAVARGTVYPCFFGSALKQEGIREFIDGFEMFMASVQIRKSIGNISGEGFCGKVFKVTRDGQKDRLVHVKVTEGTMHIRDTVTASGKEAGRINQIRVYSGEKYRTAKEATEGMVCAVTGVTGVSPEEGSLKPVLSYSVILPEEISSHDALMKFKELEEEEPGLHVVWDREHEEIHVSLMGPLQMEILQGMVRERFGFDIELGEGEISYRETINKPVKGAGHFEPLRHYAEVHLLLEPLERGSGIQIASLCHEDSLDRNWQRLIMTHLEEKEYTGALTGSAIDDIRISVIGGRAHPKHTEGGDFRQATYRAVDQALRKSLRDENITLLEPWYEFRIEVPRELVGKIIADIQRMSGQLKETEMAETGDGFVVLEGKAPVSQMCNYSPQLASLTGGRGRMTCENAGYFKCHNESEVVEKINYDPDKDNEVHSDSIFCVNGAGRSVPWDESDEMMHVVCNVPGSDDGGISDGTSTVAGNSGNSFGACRAGGNDEDNLKRIFEKSLSANRKNTEKRKRIPPKETISEARPRRKAMAERLPEYLLVDGYNIIFAWDELKELAKSNVDSATDALIDIMDNYGSYRSCRVVVVFDAYKVKGGKRHSEKRPGVEVVFTAEDETADTYIERITYELRGKFNIRVATSDRLVQTIVFGNNGAYISAGEFRNEVRRVEESIQEIIERNNRKNSIEHRNTIKLREDGKR